MVALTQEGFMKTIGLLGGMSWESTELYYRWINEQVKKRLGGLHSAKIVLVSVDFQEVEALQHQNRWDEAGQLLAKASQQVEAGGADFLLICTNTMHKGRLVEKHGLDVIVPSQEDRELVHRVIYGELCLGKVRDASRKEYCRIIDQMQAQGAEGVIEGCTEIVMLVKQSHTSVPLFDTTAIHAEEAVNWALVS